MTQTVDDMAKLLASQKVRANVSVLGHENEHQIVKYDMSMLGDLRVLAQPLANGSIFQSTRIWWQIGVYVLMAGFVAAAFFLLVPTPAKIDYASARELSAYFNMILPFLFGIYLNNIFGRWWTMRTEGIGMINNSVNNLSVMLSSQCHGSEFLEAQHVMLRYGLLTHELTFRIARGTDGDMTDMVKAGALSDDENEVIKNLAGGKAQAIWVWIQMLWDGLFSAGLIPAQVHQVALGHIANGRQAAKLIRTHLNTQMPFVYTHLMACLVHINLLVLAIQAGIVIAKCIGKLQDRAAGQEVSDIQAEVLLITQMLYLLFIPLIYLGFLEFSNEIADPFGVDMNDFPRPALHNVMHDENESFFKMADAMPPAIVDALKPTDEASKSPV
jgi:hypothetical protein